MRRVTDQKEVRPVWNNAQRVNHQNKLTHPHPKRNFVSTVVLTKSGNVPVNTAKQSSRRTAISNSTARYVNTAASRPTVNGAKPSSNVFHKSHSSVKRTFYQRTAPKNSDFKEKVNTTKVNNVTTARTKAVVSVVQGHEENAGNPQYALQDQGIFDSGCSRHMTRNKFYLSDYQYIDGGFVAFGGSSKGAPRAWYETLSTYLLENGFRRGTIDKTLFIKKDRGNILLVQVYVDDIIFGSTKKSLCDEFEQIMNKRFQMSSMRELTFFLGLKTASTPIETNKAMIKDEEAKDVDVHLYRSMIGSLMYITASRPNIMFVVCACARFQVTPKISHLYAVKMIFRYLKGQPKLGLWYPRDSPFDLESIFDIANSTTEAEYVAAANCCGQVLWIQNQMLDYGFNFMNIKIYIDNESTICIVKNLVFHSKTKHIEIRHHFIRDSHEKKLIQDRQTNMVGFGEMRQLEVSRLILEEIGYNWYALTKNPTIYVSLIKKFWQTAIVRTVDNGEQEINATVDGKEFTITEASVRRHLQLADADGISVLPNTKIFDQLTLMGYVLTDDKLTFQKGKFSPQWRFLIHTILHCLSPKKTSWEQFSSNIATALVCLATNRTFKFSKLIFDGMVKNLDSKYKFLMYPRFIQIFLDKNKRFLKPHNRTYIAPTLTPKLFSNMKRGFSGEHTPLFPSMLALQAEEGEGSGNPSEPQPPPSTAQPTHEEPIPNIESSSPQKTQSPRQALNKDTELPQTSVPIPYVPDEAVHQERGDSVERAATTATSLEAVQDSSNIAKTQSTATPTEPISQETGSDGGPRRQETMGVPLFKLALSKHYKLKQRQERAGYEATIRLQEQLDEEERQRIARDAEVAQRLQEEIDASKSESKKVLNSKTASSEKGKSISEVDQARMLVDLINQRKRYFATQKAEAKRNKPMTQAQQRTYISNYIKHIGSHTMQQLKRYTFDELKEIFETIMKHVSTFTSIETEDKERESELVARSSKRPKAEHDEESVKKHKLKENDAKKEELRACLDIVSRDEIAMDFETLATTYPIIDWKTHILIENMMYYQIIKADGSSKNYKIFSEMLDDFDRQDVLDLHRVHVLLMGNGIAIHMMIEKKYSLTQEMLSRMINRRLEVDHESEMAFEPLRFTRS
ncbi:putative ribonuclease H-like domain-containing protein [Tanacetum coccineum]|uniref:Ribonuclease H-like domain-containing protein n=1 Tax=Tanacetum coccineum TaxID=301880 RepID=A0ABQ5ERQ3_9ASTR